MQPLLKQSLLRSLVFSLGATVLIFVLAFGLFTTHEEVGIPAGAALSIAGWAFPVILLVSFAYYAVKGASARR